MAFAGLELAGITPRALIERRYFAFESSYRV